ncbi:MAG: 2-C-methyl-D-erythritol 2,4-cyclodiphosphate synthase [Acetivibrionales bacterium]
MRQSIADLLGIDISSVGITATSGEGLTEFGKGKGIFCTAVITAQEVL